MSWVTKHVGFGLTYSSTFVHPDYTARLLNSLDHITGGRVAMNLVTSTRKSDSANFGFDELVEHGARYERMEEFVDVCRKLWDCATGRVTDPCKIHDVQHHGRFFKVDGPLNSPSSPQGRPVLIQAGGFPRGIRASAYVANHVFGGDVPLAQQVQQRVALDKALIGLGRDPAKVGILWQTPLTVAATSHEAMARRNRHLALIPPEAVGAYLSYNGGNDLSTLPTRFKLGDLQRDIIVSNAAPMGVINRMAIELGTKTEISRAELLEHGARFTTDHENMLAGTASEIADTLEERFEATGSRGGFMLGHTASLLEELTGIVELPVPKLQRRGRFRTRYVSATLRDLLAEA